MIAYIEEKKDVFIQCQSYDRRNDAGFQDGSILKSLAFTNDSRHLVASQKDIVNVYTLNGWDEIKLYCQVQLNSTDQPTLSVANNSADQIAVYSETSKQLVIFSVNQDTKESRQKVAVKIDLGSA